MSRVFVPLLTLLLLTRCALADSVIDLEVQAGGVRRTVHFFVQGAMVRVEDGSTVTICDARGGRLYRLDTARKTYRVETLGQLRASMSDRLRRADSVNVRSRVVAGSGERKVAGMSASSVALRIDYAVESLTGAPAVGMPSGGTTPRAPVGIPMGGGSADDGVESPRPRDLRVEAEYWLADTAPASETLRREILVCTMPTRLPLPLMSGLLEQLGKQGDRLPVASRFTLSEVDPGSDEAPAQTRDVQTITSEVIRVETKPLDRMLFIVPADFTQGE